MQDPMECCLEQDHKLLHHQYQLIGYICHFVPFLPRLKLNAHTARRMHHLMCFCTSRKVLQLKLRLGLWLCIKSPPSIQYFNRKLMEYEKQNQMILDSIGSLSRQKKHKSDSFRELSIAYCKYNYVQYEQSAAFWQPAVLQSSCPVMPVLTERGLEIAGLVLRG